MKKTYKELLMGSAVVFSVCAAVYYGHSPEERGLDRNDNIDPTVSILFNEKYDVEDATVLNIKKQIENLTYTDNDVHIYKDFVSFNNRYEIIENTDLCLEPSKKTCFNKAINDKNELYELVRLNDKDNKSLKLLSLLSNKEILNTNIPKNLQSVEKTDVFFQSMDMFNFNILKMIEDGNKDKAVSLFNKINKEKISQFKNANTLVYKLTLLSSLQNDVSFSKLVEEKYGIKFSMSPITRDDKLLDRPILTELEITYNINDSLFKRQEKANKIYMDKILTERLLSLSTYMSLDEKDSILFKDKHKTIPFKTGLDELIIKGAPKVNKLLSMDIPDFSFILFDINKYNKDIK